MGVSPVIPHLHLIVLSLLFITCQSVENQNLTMPTAPILNVTNVASEGGTIALPSNNTTHLGREHMIKVSHNETHVDAEHMIKVNHTEAVIKLPPYEVGQKNDNKTSVPKKDAILTTSHVNNVTTNTSSVTTTTPVPHKPSITIGEDEEPPNSNAKPQSNDTQKHGISIESVTQKSKKTDYVVPIVAVIMSVPLVAIVFSVLYKRGADWWQHRHYRRMDFLIEGMYNN